MLDGFKISLMFLIISLLAVSLLAIPLSGNALAEDDDRFDPEHSVGMDDSDWWTVYPHKNVNSGSAVEHPDWVLKALKDKPLLILIHQNNCVPCKIHVPRINEAVQTYRDDIHYYDVLAEGSGYLKAKEILDAYNPTGKRNFVPTTIFLTLIENEDGQVEVGWHSEVDIMSTAQINSYIEDSIYYYEKNAADWEQ